MTDLVVTSLEQWDNVWRRNQHLLSRLLQNGIVDRVLFVEPSLDILHDVWTRTSPQIRDSGLRAVHLDGIGSGRLWALRPRKLLPRRLHPGGDDRRARHIASVAARLGLETPILWVNDPFGAEVLALTGWRSLYDVTDDWLAADRPTRELARLRRQERFLLENCDQVVVCSPALVDRKSALRQVSLIPNAVDLEAYRTLHPRPADLPNGRVALYLGTAHPDRLDVDLCVTTASHIAKEVGGFLVLVGPVSLPAEDLDKLRQAGVVLLGPRPSGSVPAYLQNVDTLVVPHVLTEFTSSLDPIKAYEYRAARRPVVSTPVSGFVNTPDELVTSVPREAFPTATAQALTSPAPQSRSIPGDIPTWLMRVSQFEKVLNEIG